MSNEIFGQLSKIVSRSDEHTPSSLNRCPNAKWMQTESYSEMIWIPIRLCNWGITIITNNATKANSCISKTCIVRVTASSSSDRNHRIKYQEKKITAIWMIKKSQHLPSSSTNCVLCVGLPLDRFPQSWAVSPQGWVRNHMRRHSNHSAFLFRTWGECSYIFIFLW